MGFALLVLLAGQSPPFTHSAAPVTRAQLGSSWHSGCPGAPSSLRRLRLGYWGFDGKPHVGTLVVSSSAVGDLTVVFRRLYRARFPIRRMSPITAYGSSGRRAVAADDTPRAQL